MPAATIDANSLRRSYGGKRELPPKKINIIDNEDVRILFQNSTVLCIVPYLK